MIDADILLYEIGSRGQYINDDDEIVALPFAKVADMLHEKVEEICALVWATEDPLLFLSMTARAKKRQARKAEKLINRLKVGYETTEDEVVKKEILKEAKALKATTVYKPNFRDDVAKKKGYKANRSKVDRPIHYDALFEYIIAAFDCNMSEGLEADDSLSIYQREAEHLTTIICSRDKDLKMIPGMHFSWECGKQAQFGPERVTNLGRLNPIYRGVDSKGKPKLAEIKGTGMLFFCAQLITGDTVDNIPGLAGKGVVAAYTALKDITEVEVAFIAVQELYEGKFGKDWGAEMLEQGRLLWMVDSLNDDGTPTMWEIPECMYKEDNDG